jgi:hypothetical protein
MAQPGPNVHDWLIERRQVERVVFSSVLKLHQPGVALANFLFKIRRAEPLPIESELPDPCAEFQE